MNLGVIMQSVAGTLIGVLLMWIAGNQVTLGKGQAVLQRDFVAQADSVSLYMARAEKDNQEMREWMSQVWPRLRTHGENIAILKNEIEDVCACKIELKRPEEF